MSLRPQNIKTGGANMCTRKHKDCPHVHADRQETETRHGSTERNLKGKTHVWLATKKAVTIIDYNNKSPPTRP